ENGAAALPRSQVLRRQNRPASAAPAGCASWWASNRRHLKCGTAISRLSGTGPESPSFAPPESQTALRPPGWVNLYVLWIKGQMAGDSLRRGGYPALLAMTRAARHSA